MSDKMVSCPKCCGYGFYFPFGENVPHKSCVFCDGLGIVSEQKVIEDKATDVADKLSSIKYNF